MARRRDDLCSEAELSHAIHVLDKPFCTGHYEHPELHLIAPDAKGLTRLVVFAATIFADRALDSNWCLVHRP